MGDTSWILFTLLVLLVLNYLVQIALQRIKPQFETQEGFSAQQTVEYLQNDKIYDEFYASVYDQLTQNLTRTQAKVALIMTEWKHETKPEEMTVVDAGCGTGVGSVALAKMDVAKVLAVDSSPAMLAVMKKDILPKSTLSEKQKARIEQRTARAEVRRVEQSRHRGGALRLEGREELRRSAEALPPDPCRRRTLAWRGNDHVLHDRRGETIRAEHPLRSHARGTPADRHEEGDLHRLYSARDQHRAGGLISPARRGARQDAS
jgi:SAM-dependent methyltransferase